MWSGFLETVEIVSNNDVIFMHVQGTCICRYKINCLRIQYNHWIRVIMCCVMIWLHSSISSSSSTFISSSNSTFSSYTPSFSISSTSTSSFSMGTRSKFIRQHAACSYKYHVLKSPRKCTCSKLPCVLKVQGSGPCMCTVSHNTDHLIAKQPHTCWLDLVL